MTLHFVNLLDQLRRHSLRMASLVEDIVGEACDAVFESDEKLAARVVSRDAEVDAEEVTVEAEVIRLMALYQPVGADLRLLCAVLKVNNDLERIADCAVNIAERARHLHAQHVSANMREVGELASVVRKTLGCAVRAYGIEDPEAAREVFRQEETADALYGQIIRNVVTAVPETPESIADYLDLLSVAKNLERIADHATNIAEDVIFLISGQIVRHRREMVGEGDG